MYKITYKHYLKSGKNLNDFKNWLRNYWCVQKTWGACSVRFWRDTAIASNNILFCEYRVDNIENWTESAMDACSENIIRDFETIAETRNIIITRESLPAAKTEAVTVS